MKHRLLTLLIVALFALGATHLQAQSVQQVVKEQKQPAATEKKKTLAAAAPRQGTSATATSVNGGAKTAVTPAAGQKEAAARSTKVGVTAPAAQKAAPAVSKDPLDQQIARLEQESLQHPDQVAAYSRKIQVLKQQRRDLQHK